MLCCLINFRNYAVKYALHAAKRRKPRPVCNQDLCKIISRRPYFTHMCLGHTLIIISIRLRYARVLIRSQWPAKFVVFLLNVHLNQ